MNKNELLKKLRGIAALAERGVGGEAENAETLLARLMGKYGVTEEEIADEVKMDFEFTYHGTEEETLLRQVAYKVFGESGRLYTFRYTHSGRKDRTHLGTKCTKAEKVEIEFLFDFYKRLWAREREAFLSAFTQKHKLFAIRDDIEPSPISKEELMKMSALMEGKYLKILW